jgi:hypothetical protein
MNATELYLKDGRSARIFFCARCRCVAPTEDLAGKCCQNYHCQVCGKDTGERGWLVCNACRCRGEEVKEASRFARAEKLSQWDGWIYAEGVGDEYFDCVETMLEACDSDGLDAPEYVWACKENHFIQGAVSDITERVADEAYEGFDPDGLEGLDELKDAIEKFNKANKDVVSYSPDYTKALVLKPQVAPV